MIKTQYGRVEINGMEGVKEYEVRVDFVCICDYLIEKGIFKNKEEIAAYVRSYCGKSNTYILDELIRKFDYLLRSNKNGRF